MALHHEAGNKAKHFIVVESEFWRTAYEGLWQHVMLLQMSFAQMPGGCMGQDAGLPPYTEQTGQKENSRNCNETVATQRTEGTPLAGIDSADPGSPTAVSHHNMHKVSKVEKGCLLYTSPSPRDS